MNHWYIRLAALYFFLGNLAGIYMSMKHNFDLTPFHAHVNLLGWASSALFGLIFRTYPAAEASSLFKWQFWLYHLGFIVMMFGLFFVLQGSPGFEPVIAVGANALSLGVLLFVINMWKNGR